MGQEALAIEFRRRLEEMHLPLKNYGPEDDRFVFELDGGEIAIDPHPSQARRLLRLAIEIFTKGQGLALELARLVAKREALEDDPDVPHVVHWRRVDRTFAEALPEDYVTFEDWIRDQFLLEELIARLDEGTPI